MNEGDLPSKLLALARMDLRAAEILRDQPDVGDSIVGFHAQQAAEKALKAWLAVLGIDFPRTHDLSLLIHKLDNGGVDVTSLWELLNLNPFAVQLRYENRPSPMGWAEGSQAFGPEETTSPWTVEANLIRS